MTINYRYTTPSLSQDSRYLLVNRWKHLWNVLWTVFSPVVAQIPNYWRGSKSAVEFQVAGIRERFIDESQRRDASKIMVAPTICRNSMWKVAGWRARDAVPFNKISSYVNPDGIRILQRNSWCAIFPINYGAIGICSRDLSMLLFSEFV